MPICSSKGNVQGSSKGVCGGLTREVELEGLAREVELEGLAREVELGGPTKEAELGDPARGLSIQAGNRNIKTQH